MTSVIKSGLPQGRAIRALNAALVFQEPDGAAPPQVDPLASLQAALAEALSGQQARDDRIAGLERAEAAAYARGVEEGRALGAAEAHRRTDELLDQLALVGGRSAEALADGLAGLETAAAELAGVALSRLVENADQRRALVIDTVRRASVRLFDDAAAIVEVSAEDFTADAALAALGGAETFPFEVRAVAGLFSGDCRVRLRLGELDLGLDRQLQRLRGLIEDFGGGGA